MSKKLNRITKVESLGGFRLRFHFSDGSAGEHDFSTMVQEPGSMLVPLRDPSYFAQVSLVGGAPTWPNGYDIGPDWVWTELEHAGELRSPATAK